MSGDLASLPIPLEELLKALEPRLDREYQAQPEALHDALECIITDLRGRGIDVDSEQAFTKLAKQCREHVHKVAMNNWNLVQASLRDPFPLFGDTGVPRLLEFMDKRIGSPSEFMAYFRNFAENRGRPELQSRVDDLAAEVAAERTGMMQWIDLEAQKLAKQARRDEHLRLHSQPTYMDQKLRWLKDNPILTWLYFIIAGLGILGGLLGLLSTLGSWMWYETSLPHR